MELRTYVGKGVSTVSASVERVDTERVRVRLKKGTATSATLIASNAEADALLKALGALKSWAWDARSASIDPVLPASRVTANVKTPNMALTSWAVATADAGPGDPEYNIPRLKQGGSIIVRVPLGTRPDPSGDGHLTVRDVERGVETDFWQAKFDSASGRIVSCSAAVTFPLGAVNEQTTGWGGNAANTPLRRGLVTPEDLLAALDADAALPYTLQFGIPNIAAGSPRWPALHNAPTGDNSSVPEGTWIRLDPAVDVSSLPGWQRVIARTLQRHGAICRDNSGTFCIYGENPVNRGVSWALAGLSGGSAPFSAGFPWARLQVLTPPAP